MTTTLEELKSDVSALRARADVADSRAMETKQLLTDLKSDLSSLKAVVTEDIQGLRAETGPLYGLVKAVPVDIGQINANIADVKRDVTNLGEEMSKLRTVTAFAVSGVTILKTQVADLTTEMGSLKADVTGVKGDVSGLRADMSDLKTDMSGIKADVSGLKSDITGLKGRVARMDTRQDRMDANIVGLKQDIGSIMRHLGVDEAGE